MHQEVLTRNKSRTQPILLLKNSRPYTKAKKRKNGDSQEILFFRTKETKKKRIPLQKKGSKQLHRNRQKKTTSYRQGAQIRESHYYPMFYTLSFIYKTLVRITSPSRTRHSSHRGWQFIKPSKWHTSCDCVALIRTSRICSIILSFKGRAVWPT